MLNVFKINIALAAMRVKRKVERVQLTEIKSISPAHSGEGMREGEEFAGWSRLSVPEEVRSGSRFFLRPISKILVLKKLGTADRPLSPQNLEPQGLTGKILRNKELAASSAGEPDPLGR
jgi:hypothetical protein